MQQVLVRYAKAFLCLIFSLALICGLNPAAAYAEADESSTVPNETTETSTTENTADTSTETDTDSTTDTTDENAAQSQTTTTTTTTTVDDNGNVIDSNTEQTTDQAAAQAAEPQLSTQETTGTSEDSGESEEETNTTYSLSITSTVTPVSSSNSAAKTIKISQPVLTTTVTNAETGKVISTTTQTYTLTVKVHVRNNSWNTATLKSGTYTYTASSASSGDYIQAVCITPSNSLKQALSTAGLTFYYRATNKGFGTLDWAKAGNKAGSTGNSAALTKLTIKTGTTEDLASLDTTTPYIAKTTITVKTTKKSGCINSLKVSVSSNVSGGVTYTIHANGTNTTKSNASKASCKSKRITYVKVKLTGELAQYFNVYYRTHFYNRLWQKWTKNNGKAGTLTTSLKMDKLSVKLVKKNSSAPTGGYYQAYSKTAQLVPLSGDKALDKKIYSITKSRTLKQCYTWIIKNGNRCKSGKYSRVYRSISTSWLKKEAKRLLITSDSDCYGMSSAFYWCAKAKNYNVREVCGTVPSRSQGRANHSWVEIKKNGTWYLYDPDLGRSYPSRNFYGFTINKAPTSYVRLYT